MKHAARLASSAAIVAMLAIVGCGDSRRSDSRPASATNAGAGNPLTAPVDYLGAVGAAQKRAATTVDMTSLQQAVRAFQAGEDRLPGSLQELVSEGYLPRLPAPPKGMQWAYRPQSGQVGVVAAGPAAAAGSPPLPGR